MNTGLLDLEKKLTGSSGPYSYRMITDHYGSLAEYAYGPKSLIEIARKLVQRGDKPFIMTEAQSYSYRDIFDQSNRILHQLGTQLEIPVGAKVALVVDNKIAWTAAFFALARAGAIPVLISQFDQRTLRE